MTQYRSHGNIHILAVELIREIKISTILMFSVSLWIAYYKLVYNYIKSYKKKDLFRTLVNRPPLRIPATDFAMDGFSATQRTFMAAFFSGERGI